MLQENNIIHAEVDTRRSFLIIGVGVVAADVLGEELVVFSTVPRKLGMGEYKPSLDNR